MRKTIITRNRSITFIQSWWVKSTLLFFVVAFIFFSCGDDLSTIGFKPDENKFKVSYKEIELPSSVFLSDPLVTSNLGGDGVTPRVLVGSYWDEKFGKIKSEAFLQIRPNSLNPALPADATLESLVLNLSFDYYHYGTQDPINMNFYVHEITDSLITKQAYTPTAAIDYSPAPIGLATYGISPTGFDEKYTRNTDADGTNDAMDTVSIALDRAYAESLFAFAKTSSDDYVFFNRFKRIFKGLAIRSDASTQIVGINPSYVAAGIPRTRLVLYYGYTDDTGAARKGKLEFFTYADGAGFESVSFSKIFAERAGTPFQGTNDLYKEFTPDGDNRFIGSGDPVVTKFDLSNFFSFADTIPSLLINSAELVIDPVDVSVHKGPNSLAIRTLNINNHYLVSGDTVLPAAYSGFMVYDKDGNIILGQGYGTEVVAKTLALTLTNSVYSYKGVFTNYFQALYAIKDPALRQTRYGLVAADPSIGKSVNRLVFSKSNLKLKIYYTTPSTRKED